MADSRTRKRPAMAALEDNASLTTWWLQQWMETSTPLARMQLAWLQALGEAMQHEAEFLKVVATSGEKVSRCLCNQDTPTPAELSSCYQEAAMDVADAAMQRFHKVSELSHDLRERIGKSCSGSPTHHSPKSRTIRGRMKAVNIPVSPIASPAKAPAMAPIEAKHCAVPNP